MTYIIICVAVYLILVLLLWSLCAASKGSFAGSQSCIEDAELRKGVFGIPSAAIRKLNIGCQGYIIQSLYSKDFILPEDSGLKYKFRNPLPSFDAGYSNYSIHPDSCSRNSSVVDSKAISDMRELS